ncbi:hypothetical protein ACSFA8_17665 [Variovorax sp. RT4R15]|uniref:hypothetical protein n=1 Tax=Variovorax sp. RT4R15 TaxID=3443737 RepID=UPI003F45458C
MNRQQQLDQFSLALHRSAIAMLRREPGMRARPLDTLHRWQRQAGATRSDALWGEWEQLLGGDFALLEQAALAESDHGQLLRSVSPLGSLVDQHERMALLRHARAQAAAQ